MNGSRSYRGADWEQDRRKRPGAGIEAAVYTLYGLTPAEIKLVEESTSR